MSVAIPITRLDCTASELRGFVSKCGDGAQVRRLLAIALVLDGRSRAEAAELNGMDRQTLSDWVHRYNADGIDGLKSRLPPGAAPRLSEAQRAELRELVVAGRIRRKTRSSAGAAWIYRRKSPAGSRCECMKARWANGCANWV